VPAIAVLSHAVILLTYAILCETNALNSGNPVGRTSISRHMQRGSPSLLTQAQFASVGRAGTQDPSVAGLGN